MPKIKAQYNEARHMPGEQKPSIVGHSFIRLNEWMTSCEASLTCKYNIHMDMSLIIIIIIIIIFFWLRQCHLFGYKYVYNYYVGCAKYALIC